jgi:DNA-binding CsgD family transcriptional regulator
MLMENPTHTDTAQPAGFAHSQETTAPGSNPRPHRKSGFDPEAEQLSAREIEVLQLICREYTNIEIGDQLCLSPRTVETYRRTMMEKIGCRNTVGLVLYALRRGIIKLGQEG